MASRAGRHVVNRLKRPVNQLKGPWLWGHICWSLMMSACCWYWAFQLEDTRSVDMFFAVFFLLLAVTVFVTRERDTDARR